MKMDTFNELKEKSKNGKVFIVMENGKNIVCENINDLPFLSTTLGEYITNLEKGYNDKLEALEDKAEKQEKIINELTSALRTLNKEV